MAVLDMLENTDFVGIIAHCPWHEETGDEGSYPEYPEGLDLVFSGRLIDQNTSKTLEERKSDVYVLVGNLDDSGEIIIDDSDIVSFDNWINTQITDKIFTDSLYSQYGIENFVDIEYQMTQGNYFFIESIILVPGGTITKYEVALGI